MIIAKENFPQQSQYSPPSKFEIQSQFVKHLKLIKHVFAINIIIYKATSSSSLLPLYHPHNTTRMKLKSRFCRLHPSLFTAGRPPMTASLENQTTRSSSASSLSLSSYYSLHFCSVNSTTWLPEIMGGLARKQKMIMLLAEISG